MDYYHNCSRQYLDSISPALYDETVAVLAKLPKRSTQAEINKDLFWILTIHGWSYDSTPGVWVTVHQVTYGSSDLHALRSNGGIKVNYA